MDNEKEFTNPRYKVLQTSLTFEDRISRLLASVLNIKKPSETYSFGNTSKALSFNQKLFLLIDAKALDDSAKTKFVKFMEIRNQFMHNLKADSFETCMKYIDGCEKYLLKTYPPIDTMSKEEQLEKAYELLLFDLNDYFMDVMEYQINALDKSIKNIDRLMELHLRDVESSETNKGL